MTLTPRSFLERGYIPLACNRYAGVAWQGEYLNDFWMWNRQLARYEGGVSHIRTVRVTELKEAALRYWQDGWVPVKPIDEAFLRRMEAALRAHKGLGVTLPVGRFLEMPEEIPEELLGPEVRRYLGIAPVESAELKPLTAITDEDLKPYRMTRGG